MINRIVKVNKLYIISMLCIIFSLRIFVMYMILPIAFSHGLNLKSENTFLIGIAISMYGFFQAFFQIPFGILSDRIGRKSVIILCLLLFFLGSLLSSISNSIYQFIFSRMLQGSGAISSTIMAYISDIIEEKNRTKVIFLLGICIGLSFSMAIILGPVVINNFGFHKLFVFISILIFFCIVSIFLFFPKISYSDSEKIILNKNYFSLFQGKFNFYTCSLFFSIFCLQLILMLNFLVFPKKLLYFGIGLSSHWKIYCFTIVISFLLILFIINYLEKNFSKRFLLLFFIMLLIISECLLLFSEINILILFLSIQVFFIAFNFLESFIPSTLSKFVSIVHKGMIMGFYSTSQFFGSAVGASIGGWLLYRYSVQLVVYIVILLCLLWLIFIFFYFKKKINKNQF